jgi:V8-like Glu-specific endopeptidase
MEEVMNRTMTLRAVTAGLLVALAAPQVASAAAPPHKLVTTAQQRKATATPMKRIVDIAKPLPMPRALGAGNFAPRAEHPRIIVDGTAPAMQARNPVKIAAAAAAAQNGYWPGAYNANPNRQIGKLYFDMAPGAAVDIRHCSATAVNSENKSVVVTAGHCVYSPDPDKNGRIDGNGFWHESVQFCPGYENGCKLGTWNARQLWTTNSWFRGTDGLYDWRDDMAVVLVAPNSSGAVVNAVGGHGIMFNSSTGRQRYAFGYPAPDSRFPEYSYSGEDLVYCPGTDRADGGIMTIDCTMTGGASGGPWITDPRSDWLGYVNGVNSHKQTHPTMGSPYFDNPESNLFAYVRAR